MQPNTQTPSTIISAPSVVNDNGIDNAPFLSANDNLTAQQEQKMQQRFLQHFESARFETAIEPDHADWLTVPTHKHTLRFNVCERVAAKMYSDQPNDILGRRAQDVWLGTEVDRGRTVLQRLGMEITSRPRIERDELNPHRIALEYDVDMREKDGPVKPHESLPQIAKALADATSYYYNARKDALGERGEDYAEPTMAR